MRVLIEQVKATKPMAYPLDFRLPVARWDESEDILAHYRDQYGPVERTYDAAKGLNHVLHLREQRQRAAGGELYVLAREPLAVNAEDGLDRVHGLAGEALDALGQRHNDSFQPDPPHEDDRSPHDAREAAGQKRQRAKERRKETLLRFADQGEGYREQMPSIHRLRRWSSTTHGWSRESASSGG